MNYGAADQQQQYMMRAGNPQQAGQPGQPGPGQHMQQPNMMMGAGGAGQMGPGGQMGQMNRSMYGMGPGMAGPGQPVQPGQPGYPMTQQQLAFQQQQQQHQQNQLNHILSRLPQEARDRINQERDQNQRNAMIRGYFQRYQQHQIRQQQAAAAAAQAQQQQGHMNPAAVASAAQHRMGAPSVPGGVMGMRPGQPMPGQQYPPGSQQSQQGGPGSQQMQQPMSQHQQQPMSVGQTSAPGSVPGPGSVHGPHSHLGAPRSVTSAHPVPSPQVSSLQAGAGQASGSSPGAVLGQSPAVMNPRTPGQGPMSANPSSQHGPSSQEQSAADVADRNSDEYKDTLKKFKAHHEDVKRIHERLKIDGLSLLATDRILEIMDDRRQVPLLLLTKLIKNIEMLVERHSVTFPLSEILRSRQNQSDASASGSASQSAAEQKTVLPDPYAPVRHKMIRVPAHIQRLYKSGKRSADSGSDGKLGGDETLTKRAKSSSIMPAPAASPSLGSPGESDSTGASPQDSTNSGVITMPCMFDSRVQWSLSSEASRELAGCQWRIEPGHAPAGRNTPDVLICIESDVLLCCPLRVLLPQSYPEEPAVVLYDQSFPPSAPLSQQLETLFRRRIALQPDRSLTSIQHAWRDACDQQLALQGGFTASTPFVPAAQAKQLVA